MNVFNLIPTLGLQVQYQAKQNQAVMNDDVFLGSQGLTNEVNFYSIERKRVSYSSIDFNNAYLQVFITLDPQVDQYQRTIYIFLTCWDLLEASSSCLKHSATCWFAISLQRNTTRQLFRSSIELRKRKVKSIVAF